MRLSDLHPKLNGTAEAGTLRFDCPIREHGHKIRVPLGTSYWHATGDFPDSFTVLPSVNATGPTCNWHGNVTNGEVSMIK